MLTPELVSQMRDLADEASAKADQYTGLIGPAQEFIVEHFGQNGLMASYIVLAVLVLFVVSRIAKLTFSTVKFLVIPSVALAFVASLVLPFSFAAALPVSVTLCSLFLLFRG